jgi:LmbE family N-acetylglucosaminyl deacetylase
MWTFNTCLIVVAHPDDETLWAGGTMLMHSDSNWTVITLCKSSDPEREAAFFKAMELYGAHGLAGDLDDSPDQPALSTRDVRRTLLGLLPPARFDLLITHGFQGEYSAHLRHDETGKAVLSLWESGDIVAPELWRFAYEDGDGKYLPRAIGDADFMTTLPHDIWQQKHDIITQTYGFAADSAEAQAAPKQEAFWCFRARARRG